jgi:hypothetical protein
VAHIRWLTGILLVALAIPSTANAGRTARNFRVAGDMPLVAKVGVELLDIVKGGGFVWDGALLVGVAGGTGGGEARLGYALVSSGSGGYAMGAAATVVRTWGDPWNAEKDETYVGPELFVQDKIRIGLGALVRVGDPDMRVIPRIEVGLGYLSGL